MIVEPIGELVQRRRVGLLDPAGDVTDEDGWTLPLRKAQGYAVYAWPGVAQELAVAGVGELLSWCGQPIRYRPVGVKSWPVGLITAGDQREHTVAASLDALAAWRDWLAEHRARAFATSGSTSWELLRATLREPLRVSGGDPPPLRGVIGGRQYAATPLPLHVAGPAVHYDVRAAYARVLSGTVYGGRWLELGAREKVYGRPAWQFFHSLEHPVFVRCRVRVPELELGPLPRHPAGGWPVSEQARANRIWNGVEYPVGCRLQGTWAAAEIELALELGCTIEHLQGAWTHVPVREGPGRLPFEPFWWAIEQGRKMGGLAGSMAKIVGNSLWGQFAIRRSGWKETISYRDGRRLVDRSPTRGGRSRAYDLAEHITGSVRAMLARQMISLGVDTVACAHTDGLWSTRELDRPAPAGRWWRVTEKAAELRVLGPQLLAARVDGAWLYTASGVPAEMLEEGYFEERWAARTRNRKTIRWPRE